MKKFSKILALLLALVMVFSMAVTAAAEETEAEAEEEETVEEGEEGEEGAAKLVYATSTFGQKFSPFFYTTVYDAEVVSMVTGSLLASDRGGAIVEHGIEGEDREYNGTVYHYDGMGDVEVVQNEDGTVDYFLTMREGVLFSDGEEANIDDVIFGIYVCCDPTYDGSSTIYALPIIGMDEYRGGMDSRGNAIFAAGDAGYEENENYTQEQYDAFWDYYNNEAGAAFAQEIVDYCVSKYADAYGSDIDATGDEIRADEGLQVKFGMTEWGFGDAWFEGATAADYWDAIVAAYEDDTETAESVESAGSTRLSLTIAALGSDFEAGVKTGESAANIAGIERTGDYSMTIHMSSYDATAIYSMAFTVAPLHYYGDEALYDYENDSFGFVKGDLSGVKAVTTQPMGCGPYVFEGYDNGVATFTANENYYLGAPAVKTFLFQESVDSDYVPGTVSGSFDISSPSVNDNTLNAIKDANGGELNGDVINTYLVDYRGYGYIGINADLVNIDDDPGSDESKALRKGFMTLFAVYRDTVINSYYGDRAAVIQYPISNTSWAAPKPADEGYKLAYSVDADGNAIYTDDMTDEEKYEAAKAAAVTWFKAAGLTYDEETGKFDTEGTTWEVMIPGQGEQDHPAYGIVVAASEALAELGITLQVNDVVTSVWNNQLEANSAMMWAAAWQASVDPDMTQVYHSSNAHGYGTNSNHYSVDDEALDELIVAGRASADTEERKSIYKEAMEIIMDWGCELPTYQRKDCTIASTERVNVETMPKDMTPYWGWMAELEKLEAK